MIEVPSVGDRKPRQVSRKVLAIVIRERIREILEVVASELRKSGFPKEVLTSGIVLTGGTSMLSGIEELAEEVFELPVRIGIPQEMGGVSERVRTPRYSTVIGLLQAARSLEGIHVQQQGGIVQDKEEAGGGLWARLKRWFENNL